MFLFYCFFAYYFPDFGFIGLADIYINWHSTKCWYIIYIDYFLSFYSTTLPTWFRRVCSSSQLYFLHSEIISEIYKDDQSLKTTNVWKVFWLLLLNHFTYWLQTNIFRVKKIIGIFSDTLFFKYISGSNIFFRLKEIY